MQKVVYAHKLVHHIGNCCAALSNGIVWPSKKTVSFLFTRSSDLATHWRYPVITAEINEICRILDIHVGSKFERITSLTQLVRFLQMITEPLTSALLDLPATLKSVEIHNEFHAENDKCHKAQNLLSSLAPLKNEQLPGLTLFLHGSMADGTITPFSDVDDLIILDRRAWQEPDHLEHIGTLLTRLARTYQDIDPFQHHGHWLLTEFDLLLLDQSYLPLVVLDDAVRVVGEASFTCRILNDHSGFARNAKNTLDSMKRTLSRARKHGGVNAFVLKGLVGEIAIMPAYLFQARGEMVSKPEAIRRAPELFSTDAMPALDWATRVRDEFGEFVHNPRVRLLKRVARLTCPRRHQAEWLFRRYAPWVSNGHPLGLSAQTVSSIGRYMLESNAHLEKIYH